MTSLGNNGEAVGSGAGAERQSKSKEQIAQALEKVFRLYQDVKIAHSSVDSRVLEARERCARLNRISPHPWRTLLGVRWVQRALAETELRRAQAEFWPSSQRMTAVETRLAPLAHNVLTRDIGLRPLVIHKILLCDERIVPDAVEGKLITLRTKDPRQVRNTWDTDIYLTDISVMRTMLQLGEGDGAVYTQGPFTSLGIAELLRDPANWDFADQPAPAETSATT